VLARRLKHRASGAFAEPAPALIDAAAFPRLCGFPAHLFAALRESRVRGEASGALSEILRRLVTHLSDIKSLRTGCSRRCYTLRSSSWLVSVLIVTFMTVMVPKLTVFFKGTGQPLPPATRILVQANELLIHYWWRGARRG